MLPNQTQTQVVYHATVMIPEARVRRRRGSLQLAHDPKTPTSAESCLAGNLITVIGTFRAAALRSQPITHDIKTLSHCHGASLYHAITYVSHGPGKMRFSITRAK